MLVRVNGVITAVDEGHLKINKRVTGNGTAGGCLDNAFLDRRAEILRHCTAKDLIHPLKSGPALQRFKNDLAIAKLSAAARLFLVPALDLDLLGDGFLVRYLWRVQRYLDVIAVGKFFDDSLNMKLSRTRKDKLFCLRVAVKMKAWIFFPASTPNNRTPFFTPADRC